MRKHLDASCEKGQIDESTVTAEWKKRQASTMESAPKTDPKERPPLETILNMYDFEDVAQKFLSKKSWAFQMTAANDRLTRDANAEFWKKIYFRPRVLRGRFYAPCWMIHANHPHHNHQASEMST